ncbi:hypothetical protein PAMP_021317 [Pampus punctatissimus]
MAAVPCFLSMCGRADMHRGHLKNLRVRCSGGMEFFTRSAQKVRGSLNQRFLLVDGDRAISGSYSFTWSSSRLDRNLITVITGQAVETFDLQFCDLFLTSRGVSLSKVPMVDEPIPDPLPQAAPAPVSAAIARRLINPKYALVATGTHTSPTSSDQNSSNKNSNSQNPTGLKVKKGRFKDVSEEPLIHPALANLEKAYLIPYLPTWPEPDPPSDVIGFINIRDEKRANQVHLQRSERFEVSQAIRFSSPLTLPGQNAAVTKPPSGNKSTEVSAPVSPTNKLPKEQKHSTPNKDHTDATDPRDPTQQPNTHTPYTITQDTHKPNAHTLTCESTVTADSQPTDNARQSPETQTVTAPVPKRRTLQLVIDPAPSELPGEAQVTMIKIDQQDTPDGSSGKKRSREDVTPGRGRLKSNKDGEDSGSNGNGSQDSTKVICDRVANDNRSSASTASEEEFYDCPQHVPSDSLTNGIMIGSGRGHRQGDGVNVIARLSQSMLDLRETSQSEDGSALIRQSQQLRKKTQPQPHRHIGQLFQESRSPARNARLRGPKVIIAKPGSFHRPTRAAGPVIGGHRYWQSQTLQPDSANVHGNTRSGRSPRRHSPGHKKTDNTSSQPPTNQSALLGVSFSKLSNLKYLRAPGRATQKKVSQNKKPAR